MHKVVVERPRWNPGPGKQGRRANLPAELLPKFEGIKRPHVQRKGLTDLLGPLKRWLHSQVGRPWNDVYSEACAVIKPDSIVRAHIKTHLLEFVERHTFMRDRSVCVLDTWRGGGIRPVTAKRFGRSAFYVHPETGLLREIKPVSRRDWQRAQREKRQQTFRWLDDRFALKQINGIWFACQFRAIPPDGPFKAYDHALGQMVGRGGLVRRDGVYLHCIAKRQLSRRELRRFGLFNTTPIINQPQRSLQQVTAWPVDDCASVLQRWDEFARHEYRCRSGLHRPDLGGSTPPSCRVRVANFDSEAPALTRKEHGANPWRPTNFNAFGHFQLLASRTR